PLLRDAGGQLGVAGVGAPGRVRRARRAPWPGLPARRQLPGDEPLVGRVLAKLHRALPGSELTAQEDAPGLGQGRGRRLTPSRPDRPAARPGQRRLLARSLRWRVPPPPPTGRLAKPAGGWGSRRSPGRP